MLNLQKLETVEIPLSKLTLWEGNVRTTGAEEGLDELIASIRSIGYFKAWLSKKLHVEHPSSAQENAAFSPFHNWPKRATSNALMPFLAVLRPMMPT
jgi:hypothetical protein